MAARVTMNGKAIHAAAPTAKTRAEKAINERGARYSFERIKNIFLVVGPLGMIFYF
jgi:hypothetical protein